MTGGGAAAEAAGKARLEAKLGWGPLRSGEAKRRVSKTAWEPRPRNYDANHRIPSRAEIRHFRERDALRAERINGRYRGTTGDSFGLFQVRRR